MICQHQNWPIIVSVCHQGVRQLYWPIIKLDKNQLVCHRLTRPYSITLTGSSPHKNNLLVWWANSKPYLQVASQFDELTQNMPSVSQPVWWANSTPCLWVASQFDELTTSLLKFCHVMNISYYLVKDSIVKLHVSVLWFTYLDKSRNFAKTVFLLSFLPCMPSTSTFFSNLQRKHQNKIWTWKY